MVNTNSSNHGSMMKGQYVELLRVQSGLEVNINGADAHVPTEMDMGMPLLEELPAEPAQSDVEEAVPDKAAGGPMEGPEVASAEQDH